MLLVWLCPLCWETLPSGLRLAPVCSRATRTLHTLFAGRTSLQPQAQLDTGSSPDCAVLVTVSVLFQIGCCLQERKHSGTWRLVPGDASSPETWQSVASLLPRQHSLSEQHTFVLMLEVLDNLPHDRWDLKGQGFERSLTGRLG